MANKSEPATEKTIRRTSTDEFKRDADQMMIDGHSASSAPKNLGVDTTNLV